MFKKSHRECSFHVLLICKRSIFYVLRSYLVSFTIAALRSVAVIQRW